MFVQRAEAPHSAVITAVITRADGTVEHVGVVAAGFENPLRQLWWDVVGRRLSERRIKRANESAAQRSK